MGWVILARVCPSEHKPACPPNALCLRGCLCARVDECFRMCLCVCTRSRVLGCLGKCLHVSPMCMYASGLCPCAGICRPVCCVGSGHSRFSHSGLACHPRLAFPVETDHWSGVRIGVRAVRRQKGTMKARTYQCSRGAGGARRSLFSSEARKPLEKVFARIEGNTEIHPGHTHGLGGPH